MQPYNNTNKQICTRLFHNFASLLEQAQTSPRLHVYLVYFSILLDNLLLTAVVPVIPDILVKLHHHHHHRQDNMNTTILASTRIPLSFDRKNHSTNRMTLNEMAVEHHFALNGRSLAILHQLNPPSLSSSSSSSSSSYSSSSFVVENGEIGSILSAKALVQLAFNPLVSPIINRLGYELTLIIGVIVLLHSSLFYLVGVSSLSLLHLSRALQGVASALINIAGMSMMANMFRLEHVRLANIGFCLSGMATGVLVGYPLGGALYHWFGSEFLFHCILLCTGSLLCVQLVTFNWSPTNAPTRYDAKTIHIITNPLVVLSIVIITVSTATMSILESFLPLWLIKEIDPPKWKLGVVFVPDSIGYLLGTNIFAIIGYVCVQNRWLLIPTALAIIGISAMMLPMIPNLLYLAAPHFGIGLGIGTIDSTLMPLLAELVDEQFAAQYGYVYAAAQTAASTAYAFGPLIGGTLLTNRWLQFESLMYVIGAGNLLLCLLTWNLPEYFVPFARRRKSLSSSSSSNTNQINTGTPVIGPTAAAVATATLEHNNIQMQEMDNKHQRDTSQYQRLE